MLEITLKGEKIHIKGPLLRVGAKAPSFELVDQDLQVVDLYSLGDSKKILNVFVSLDTSVCAKSIHTFYEKAKSVPNLEILNISLDLPFAASRFCQAENLEKVKTLSAFNSSFPDDYGLRITDGPLRGLCARAVIVLDEDNRVLYQELVPEITQEPDYTQPLAKCLPS